MQVFSALADPTRAKIVEALARRDMTAGEIAARFPVSRPAISRHLRVLRKAHVVRSRGEAQRRVYSLNPEALDEVDQMAGAMPRDVEPTPGSPRRVSEGDGRGRSKNESRER